MWREYFGNFDYKDFGEKEKFKNGYPMKILDMVPTQLMILIPLKNYF